MKKLIPMSLALYCILGLSNCKNEDSVEPAPTPTPPVEEPTPNKTLNPATGIAMIDYGNQGDSRDIYLTFKNLTDELNVLNYNLILVKSGTDLDIDAATALSEGRMYTIEKNGNKIEQQVESKFKDADGDEIQNNQPYDAYIYTAPNAENVTGSLSSKVQIELQDNPYYEVQTLGSYPGLEALSYRDGSIIMPGTKNSLFKVDTKTGEYTTLDSGLPWPLGGGFDPFDGSYYGSMYSGGQVLKYDLAGNKSVFASGLIGPIGIAVDADKNVYITNFDANFISKVTPDGDQSVFVNNDLGLINGPDGLVMADGTLYAINFYDSKILKISSSGEPSLFTTLPGVITGYIAFADGFFYVSSISQKRIYKIDMQGNYEVISGTGISGFVDGPGLLASFTSPNGIAIAGDTIFVGDSNKIRMLIKQ